LPCGCRGIGDESERELAHAQHAQYLARASVAEAKAAETSGSEAEYWFRIAIHWRDLAKDTRDAWDGAKWAPGR
jgi:hypothetical protein